MATDLTKRRQIHWHPQNQLTDQHHLWNVTETELGISAGAFDIDWHEVERIGTTLIKTVHIDAREEHGGTITGTPISDVVDEDVAFNADADLRWLVRWDDFPTPVPCYELTTACRQLKAGPDADVT